MKRKSTGLSKAFALVLARHRKAEQISRQALSESAGLHQTYLGLVERGLRNPSLDAADMLARALGKKLSDLLCEAEDLRAKGTTAPRKRQKRQG